MAELFANALSLVKGAVLHGVSSRTRGHAEAFAARLGFSRSYRSYEELLQDRAVDIVYIATRNQHHREDSLAAINAGKPVLCEKPLALSAAEGRAVVEAARRRRVFCAEAMWMRCSPVIREVMELVRGGGVGTPELVSAQLGFPMRFDPLNRVFINPGGGSLFDLGVYPLSFIHALLGRPVRLTTSASLGSTGVDEQFAAVLEYESGCQALIAASLRTRLANAAAIHGTDGVLDLIEPLYFPNRYRLLRPISHMPAASGPRKGFSALSSRIRSRIAGVRSGAGDGKITKHRAINGYACEAVSVQDSLQGGALESSWIPLDESIEVLESMDAIRRQWPRGTRGEECGSL